MIPKRIVLENFLSFGSPETEIVFADDEPLWVLGGPNGVGKSAVFDAMTYALYGEHRGGASDHTSLVRHGANGFRVVFDFEFNGANYRITRNRPLKGGPTHSVAQSIEGCWKTLALPVGRDPIKIWSERTLGVGFAAFKASVLLRQGEADAIITAGGAERLAILKKIIGLEAYEALYDRVHEETRRCKEMLDRLKKQRETRTEITDAELEAARQELAASEEARGQAHVAHEAAIERVPRAGQWTRLEAQSKALHEKLRIAAERERDADQIRANYERLCQLTTAIPLIRKILNLRTEISAASEKLKKHETDAKKLANAVAARQLREEIDQTTRVLKLAEEVKKHKDDLTCFDPDLAEQLEAAKVIVKGTEDALRATAEAKAAESRMLKQFQQQQKDFAKVGAKCSLCGQKVTAQHAKEERDRLATEIKSLQKRMRELESTNASQQLENQAAIQEQNRLSDLQKQQEGISNLLVGNERTLRRLGVTVSCDELCRQIAEKSTEVKRLEVYAGNQSHADLSVLKKHLDAAQNDSQSAAQSLASLRGKESSEVGQLSPQWTAQLDTFDAKTLKTFDVEVQSLTKSGTVEAYRQLEQDAAHRVDWEQHLAEARQQIDEISVDSRITVAEAQRLLNTAKLAATAVDATAAAAKGKLNKLEHDAEQFRKLVDEIKAAEYNTDLHRRLDELFGKTGIQRELVRSAECEIVCLANDTVQHLSDGDLSIELDKGSDNDDEAFALKIRRADGPTPIGVNYLSGSQKFRVAVSVALAIGRFAAGQARPLESVIIDEGFGSLDRDGLRAAAAELNRLRQHLRRIVLVSHQEDFADQFPVVIRLASGENGTVAVAVRK